jgi:hypothetical protein
LDVSHLLAVIHQPNLIIRFKDIKENGSKLQNIKQLVVHILKEIVLAPKLISANKAIIMSMHIKDV